MNVIGLFFIFLVAICAVVGFAYISSQSNVAPVTDTYGHTMGNTTNSTMASMGNLTATGSQVGGGVVLLIAGLICIVVVTALVLVATRKRGGFGRGS